MPDKIISIVLIAIFAIVKLLITGVCLAIGFRIGGLFMAHTEKRIASRKIRAATT